MFSFTPSIYGFTGYFLFGIHAARGPISSFICGSRYESEIPFGYSICKVFLSNSSIFTEQISPTNFEALSFKVVEIYS